MTAVMNPKQTCRESVKNNQNQASYANCSATKSESLKITLAAACWSVYRWHGDQSQPTGRLMMICPK